MLQLSGYTITEQLYDSANSLVYRGQRQGDQRAVILKILKDTFPSPERIAWFRREYEVTKNLHLDGVARIYSLETDQQHWMMVLEDFGGDSLRHLKLAGTMALDELLELALHVATILGQVHQKHIMHKDINPANIVFNPTTRQIKLIDFGIATMLSRENPTFRNPSVMEGTLAYMSPEQAGRMNRAIDYRTDFYSFGVTLYELLTGRVPFASNDALELIHCHIAKQPIPPHVLKPDIPAALSAIVLKLMAKNAEDRYQSASGLAEDLRYCLDYIRNGGHLKSFVPGLHDVSDRFHIPQKLYGREDEIHTLLSAFERVSQGACELMLVTGVAGIGKSALVQEVYKPITRQRGFFISGKFDQFQRNIPYSAFIQAFRSLMQHLLTESETEIMAWRKRFLNAVGKNGRVLIDMLPEVELIIGPQPDVTPLGPTESYQRLNMVFHNFIGIFTQPEHPLVIFLDDVQWADTASLKLMELLMTAPDSQYLFVIASYRNNEVGADHPLWLTIDAMEHIGATIHSLALDTLDFSAVTRLIAETMLRTQDDAAMLANLVIAKTEGNPFFVQEFLKTLYVDGLIHFNHTSRYWEWSISQIQMQDMTDNVLVLMENKVQRLNIRTQEVLKLAACIGNQFDLETLAVVNEKSSHETARELWEAVAEGLIHPLSDVYKLVDLDVEGLTSVVRADYKFSHDRIQQATYLLIPPADRKAVHWRIGQLLWQSVSPELRDERIFDIVNQLNQGLPTYLVCNDSNESAEQADNQAVSQDDIRTLSPSLYDIAELNRLAGQKATASLAYDAALSYLRIGVRLLEYTGSPWATHYHLTLSLYKDYANTAYLNGLFADSEETFDLIVSNAATNLEKAQVYETKVVLYASMGHLKRAVETGLEGLKLLGVHLALVPSQIEIDREIEQVRRLLGYRNASELLDLPRVTDPIQLAIMHLLEEILINAWWRSNTNLLYLATLKLVHLSLLHGNADVSPIGYVWYGVILGTGRGDYKTGHSFGELALRLNEQFHSTHLIGIVNLVFGVFIHLWRFPLKRSISFLKRGYQMSLETGDLLWAGINAYAAVYSMIIQGEQLDDVYQEIQRYLEFARNTRQVIPINMLTLSQQFILSVQGKTRTPGSFSTSEYDEKLHIQEIQQSEAFRPRFWYLKTKLQALYLFERYCEALGIARDLDELLKEGAAFGNATVPEHYFYYSLTLAALCPSAPTDYKATYRLTMEQNQERMKHWAENCPENFHHKYLLVAAEMARLEERDKEALYLYEQAIISAQEHGYIQNAALAHELAGRFYLDRGIEKTAQEHFLEARTGYLKWGAIAKVHALDARYPLLLTGLSLSSEPVQRSPSLRDSTPPITTSKGLDLSTVMKAAQTISSEIVLDNLLVQMMHIAIENVGAERGYLILERDGAWVIQAEGSMNRDDITVLQSIPLHTPGVEPLVPLSIINYVARTRESVVLNDACSEGRFTRDRYVIYHKPRSILCAPLIKRGQLVGMVYLENNLTPGAFTPDRLEVVNLLAAQAAISIKNAVLYKEVEQSEEKYRTLFENSKDTIFITTTDGHIVNMNAAGLTLFGCSAEVINTINAAELYADPEDRATFQQTIALQRSVRDYPVTYKRRDGELIDCLMTANVRYDEDGNVCGYQGIIRDITAQKRAEEERAALLDQQARKAGELHAIIQSMADGLLVVDVDEQIVLVNPIAATLLKCDPDTLIGQPLDRLTEVDDPILASGLQHIVDQIRLEMQTPEYALPQELLSLGERMVRLESAPTRGRGNALTGAVMVIQDVTEAVEADRAKSAFIGTASHEMRTPLASLKGFVDIFYLSGVTNLSDNQRMFLDAIKRQTEAMVQLVNDLLEVARFDQGATRSEQRWVSLDHATEECLSGLATQIEKRDLCILTDIAPELPPVWIDSLHMRRILTNLVSNAVKYVHRGGTIHIRAYELNDPALLPSSPGNQPWHAGEERSIVIEVEDNGVGIRESDQAKIFTRFFRSDNTLSVEAGGSGLGLSITQSLVHVHHGQIGFRSIENVGTCFWVRFPAPSTETLDEHVPKT